MKICKKCELEKPLSDYQISHKANHIRKTDNYRAVCKKCWWLISKERQKLEKPRFDNYRKTHLKNYQDQIYPLLIKYYKTHPCLDCGETNPVKLEFDHLRDKKQSICRMIDKRNSWAKILEEIDKCQVLCSNCHQMKTAKERNWAILRYINEA